MQADGSIIIDTAIDADGLKAGSKEFEAAVRKMASSVHGLNQSTKTALNKQLAALLKQNEAYTAQAKKVDDLKQKVEEYGSQKIPTQEYREIQVQIEQAEKRLNSLIAAQERFLALGGSQNSKTFKRYQYDIDELRNTIKYARGELQDLEETGKAFTFGTQTKQAAADMERLEREEKRLLDMNRQLNISYDSLKGKVKECSAKIQSVFKALGKSVSEIFDRIKNTGTKAFSSFAKAIKNTTKSITDFNKKTKSAGMSMGKMLAMSILFSTVFRAISLVTSGVGEGIENLAQYSDTMNRSMSMMMSALTRLKNAFATAFSPILSVVAPILTRFINLLADGITYLGMFFARLTGQNSFTRAKKVQQDYAASLQDTADGAKDAADETDKAAKAAEKYLSPLDDINKFTEKNKSDSGKDSAGGSGSGGLAPGDMFETVTIPDSVKNLADKIKKYINSQDWEGLGKYIAEGINKGLQIVYDTISWENVGPKITPFINAFTRTFNSLVDNIDWDLMGRTIGAGINTLVNTLNLLITGIDWENIGKSLSEGLRGMIGEINWTELGNLIGNYFMISWDTLSGFVQDMSRRSDAGVTGWQELGTALGRAINGMFAKIDFGEIGKTLSTGINGAFETLKSFTDEVDWDGIAKNIYNGMNNMIHGINWTQAGKTLSQFATDLLGTIRDVAENTDWEAFGKGIGDFLGSIDWKTILSDVGTIIYEAASGMLSGLFDSESGTVFKLLAGFFVASKLVTIFSGFGNAVSEAMTGKTITSNIITKVGNWFSTSIIPKIFPAALTLVSTIGTWVTGTFAPALSTAFTTLASALFNPVGLIVVGAIIAGFLIWKNWDKITEWAGNVKDAVLDAFDKAKEWLKEKGSDVVQGFKDGWEAVKESKIGQTVSKMGSYVKEKAGDATQWLKQKGSDVITGIKDGYERVKDPTFLSKVAKLKDEVFSKVGAIGDKVKSKGKDIIEGLKDGYENLKESGFLSRVKNIREEVYSSIGNVKDKVLSKGRDIISGLKDGFNGDWSSMEKILGGLPDKVSKAIPSLFKTGKNVIRGFIDGLKSITIPLPHVKIGSAEHTFFGRNITLPTFSVSWYKTGGLFNQASVIGVGEEGKEAVLPLENKKSMRLIADSIVNNISARALSNLSNPRIPYLGNSKIPYLASGAVIPPNKEFLAVLGDQNKGNNIETPESLMRRVVREEVGNMGRNIYEVPVKIGRKELMRVVIDEAKMMRMQTGKNPFELA